jgi:DNA modification methylase
MNTNTIYCGNNLEILKQFPDNSVDLIYADPPFFSGRNYEVIWKDNAEIRQFEDRFKGDIEWYIEWMTLRLQQCHRVLKSTGSMYLHCDWHANAHLRIAMDKVFGVNHFQNECVWSYDYGGRSKNIWPRKHDTILFYTKSDNWTFNFDTLERVPYKGKIHEYRGDTESKVGGKTPTDVWEIPIINTMAKERLGYPTQKPEALLKRIIEASSNKDDIVLDPFCGCGTAIAVANLLQRKWIGIDVSPTACRVMQKRLAERGHVQAQIIGLPATIDELKGLEPFEFQNWVVNKIGGLHNNKKTNDKGIDGWTVEVLNNIRLPIQIKQSEDIGRNIVDNFETAMRRAKKDKGIIYAFSFGRGAYEETARARAEDNIDIELVKVSSLCS